MEQCDTARDERAGAEGRLPPSKTIVATALTHEYCDAGEISVATASFGNT
jgi:hypothetical protein